MVLSIGDIYINLLFQNDKLSIQTRPRLYEVHERLHHLLLGDVHVADALADVVPVRVRDARHSDLEEVMEIMCCPSAHTVLPFLQPQVRRFDQKFKLPCFQPQVGRFDQTVA